MASIGHVAVGMALGRRYTGRARGGLVPLALLGALALLPDADVVAFRLGIPYAAPWGHRGASHSLALAALLGLLAALLVRLLRAPGAARAGLFTFVAVASHGLLDTLTDGGLGAALLWPASNARFFAPLRPLPVAPIGAGMLSARGLYVLLVETLLFLPFFLYALWPRRSRAA
ncbi:metal-dependent hydrolase [Aggregicoccus sp. 17bor-14]|uniref:metal-dependent hydrolase n=1 Tax=Myxococcaceae TaxID=31 RepID=UPI00129CECDC|nr:MULTISPECIES: metal-dependent hydrolase [Myxococcaceae]MBF5041780.1 metal-dependent hydrolase [Simulacricoccus sp. 17bor-14]MRI87561.1 metal-dependent hydrolase [Aggregicoccus sp. 17bor-14]